jgi:hypothetical protein
MMRVVCTGSECYANEDALFDAVLLIIERLYVCTLYTPSYPSMSRELAAYIARKIPHTRAIFRQRVWKRVRTVGGNRTGGKVVIE